MVPSSPAFGCLVPRCWQCLEAGKEAWPSRRKYVTRLGFESLKLHPALCFLLVVQDLSPQLPAPTAVFVQPSWTLALWSHEPKQTLLYVPLVVGLCHSNRKVAKIEVKGF